MSDLLYTKSIKYPSTFDLISGKTVLDDKLVSINRCISLILTSAKGELLGDPEYGSRLYELLFDQYSDNLQKIVKAEIVDCISQYESRVTISDSDITIEHNDNTDRNSFNVTINYTLKNSTVQSTTTVVLEEDVVYG